MEQQPTIDELKAQTAIENMRLMCGRLEASNGDISTLALVAIAEQLALMNQHIEGQV